jgi:uncharacterized protein YggE
MNPKIKDSLGVAAVAGIVLLIVSGLQFSSAYSRSIAPAANFAVSGEGRVTTVPDVAEFTFGVRTEGGKDIASLQKDNTNKANAAIDYVKSQGVDSKDIETQSYNISPRSQSFSCPSIIYNQTLPMSVTNAITPKPCPPSQIVGYDINQTISVKIRDFSKIGDVLSGVTSRGADSVSDLNFTLRDPAESQNEARAKAIAQAESKAQDLAIAGHFRLGRILSIQEGYNPQPIPYNSSFGVGGSGMDMKATAPSIQAGSQEILSQVTITYEID